MRSIRNYAVVLLLMTSVAEAEQQQTYPDNAIQTFLGLDDTSAPTQSQDGRAQSLQNITLGVDHSIRKRFGIKLIGGSLDIPDEAFCSVEGGAYVKFSSGTERIVSLCGSRAYYLSGTTWTRINGTAVTAGQNNQFVSAVALDNLVLTNNVDVPQQWAGGATDFLVPVTFTGLSNSIQKAQAVAFFKNYLVFGNTTEAGTAYPTRIRWSNVGTINTWTDADYIDIDSLGGQTLQALVPLYDQLYAFFTHSIYRISLVGGSATFNVARVTDDIGTVSKNSLQSITLGNGQKGLMFLDRQKRVYFFNGTTALDVSQLIRTTMSGLSGTQLPYAVSDNTGTSYFLCAASSGTTTNNLCVEFQTQILEWTKHVNIPANAMWHVIDSSGNDQTYFGSDKSFVYQLTDTTNKSDVGTASGTVNAVSAYTTSTASGLTVLYTNAAAYTIGALAGAPILLVGGKGSGLTNTVADNTATGLVVTTAFSTTPDTTTTYEVGGINGYYRTKWYDASKPGYLKAFNDLYFWADADTASTLSVAYGYDFNSDTATTSTQLSANSSDSVWGTGVWDTATWGGGTTVFKKVKLKNAGRYIDFLFSDDDPGESFKLYGYVPIFTQGDLN